MRSEVQEILDKEWPDNLSLRFPIYGNRRMFSALCRLAEHAVDIGDEELEQQAIDEATKVENPDPDSSYTHYYKLTGIFSQPHKIIHANKSQVFIFREKHGDWMYDASTPEKASKALLSVIERRLEEGWFMDEYPEDEKPSDQMDIFKSNDIPDTEADKARKILELARSSTAGCLFNAGKYAYNFLMERTDYEYERFEVESLTQADFDLKKDVPF